MKDKKEEKRESKSKRQKPTPHGLIPIDSKHFYKVPICGIADCTK